MKREPIIVPAIAAETIERAIWLMKPRCEEIKKKDDELEAEGRQLTCEVAEFKACAGSLRNIVS